ncbi:MAG: hypothetical protein GY832_02500 [Chloroflexi bacterium]|nr:hypothetical protein [Chloroflexota bacterium]
MASNSDLIVFDLKQLLKDLDDHCDPSQVDEYVAYCQCGEPVGQDMNQCPVCEQLVVWLNSSVWDQAFRVEAQGDRAAAILLRAAGIIPKSRIKQWYSLRATVGDDTLVRIANGVIKWTREKRLPRNSIIPRVMNLAKQTTKKPPSAKPNNDNDEVTVEL